MDFEYSPKVKELQKRVSKFIKDHVIPNEETFRQQFEEIGPDTPIMKEIQDKARGEGLWNLFLPDNEYGGGLNNLEYAPLCEIMGRTPMAPRAFNCAAPDTGNMEILAEFGTAEQKERWLTPLLNGEIRSCFSMTEPHTAGSDPTLLQTRADLIGDEYVINGHKWFTSGVKGAALAIAMVVTNENGPRHRRTSQILVPTDTKGFNVIRLVPYMGPPEGAGHGEVKYEDCTVPATNRLGDEHSGFAIAQARLGPGRIHHCMRCIGQAELALELMCKRANMRFAHGSYLAEKGVIQDWIAQSRMEIDQARMILLYTAWKMDTHGKKEARQEISMIKVIAANVMLGVVDRSIQVHGALGCTDDLPLARLWRGGRSMRLADGADEVHKMVIARRELRRWRDSADAPTPERQPQPVGVAS